MKVGSKVVIIGGSHMDLKGQVKAIFDEKAKVELDINGEEV